MKNIDVEYTDDKCLMTARYGGKVIKCIVNTQEAEAANMTPMQLLSYHIANMHKKLDENLCK